MNVRDEVDASTPSSTSVKSPSGPEPVNANAWELCGLADLMIKDRF